jgi:serine/threonine protein phosphatase PrpC
VLQLVSRLIAATSKQVEHLAHLRVQAQTLVHRSEQLSLGRLDEADTHPRRNLLRQCFGEQAQLENGARGIEWVELLGGGAQICQEWRVTGQKTEIAHP